jgi:hypothetical protein
MSELVGILLLDRDKVIGYVLAHYATAVRFCNLIHLQIIENLLLLKRQWYAQFLGLM